MTRIVIVPDDGREYRLVPVEATQEMVCAGASQSIVKTMYSAMIAAAPQCKVVELPYRYDPETDWEHGYAACLDEIERRANESR